MTAALSPRRLSVDQSAAIVPGKEDPVAHGGAQVDEDRLDLTVLGHLRTSVLLRWLFVIVRNHHHPKASLSSTLTRGEERGTRPIGRVTGCLLNRCQYHQ